MKIDLAWDDLRNQKKDGAIACLFFFGVMFYDFIFVEIPWRFVAMAIFAFLGACVIREYLECHPVKEPIKIEVN
jgi:hypothetical protein